MAVLAVAGAGAWASAALGLGWQAGWLVGSTLGSLLFNKQPNQEGPRLSDLTVTSSAYGAPIPIGYGTLRMAGNIIWSSGIREEKHTERVGKGGGARQTTYNYFASFALALAEGPAEDVLRLWADGKLIYDKRGTGTEVAKSSFTLRFYPGSETQLPDPLIEAVEGAGNVTAHRGLCYLVFEDLALEDYGNRIPNITAELTFRRVAEQPSLALDLISAGEGSVISGYQFNELAIDWRRGFAYLVNSDASASVAGIRRFNLRSMKEDRQARMTDITNASPANFPDTLFCGTDGFLYLNVGSSNSQPILRVDPDALREVARFGASGPSLVNSTTSFAACSWMGMVSALGPQGRVDFLLTGSLFNKLGLLKAEGLAYVWGAEQAVAESRVRGIVGGITAEGYGEGWILASASSTATNHTSLALYRIRVTAFANYDAGLGQTAGVTLDLMQAFLPSEIEAGASGFYGDAGGLTYDPTDDSVIFQVQMSAAGSPGAIHTVKWRAGTGLVWTSTVPVRLNYDAGFCQSRLQGQRWSLIRGTRLVQLDTSTGTLVTDETWPLAVAENGAQVFDAATNTILVRSGPSGFVRLFLGRGSGQGETLGTVVADLCARAGLGAADVDVSELQDVVPGYVLARSSSIRGAIEPLAQAYFFDGVESDDTLQFRKRGRAPVATLNPDLLIALSPETGETWREQRTQDVELPERVAAWGNLGSGADTQQTTLASRPVFRIGGLNGRPYLECVAASSQYFEDLAFTQPSGFTSFRYFTWFAVTDQIAGLASFPSLLGSTIAAGGKVAAYFRDTADAQIHAFKSAIRIGNVASPQLMMATVGRSASGATTTPYARFWVRQNRANIFAAESQTTNPSSSAIGATQFLRSTGLGAAPLGNFNGRLYEFLLYEGTLSDTTTFAIENFLVSKYGLSM